MNTLTKIAIVMSILSAIILVIFPDISNFTFVLINNLLTKINKLSEKSESEVNPKPEVESSCLSSDEILFTKDQLSKYDGSADSLGLYLSFLGVVYDVSRGAQHYKPGASYGFFAGKDATKAFISGDFTAAGLIDDVRGLDVENFDGIQTWIDLYENDYKRVGKLIGTYYDSNGCETEAMVWVRNQLLKNDELKELQNQESQVFPYCNSEWNSQTNSGRVWCSHASGGTQRDWVGVPRQLFMTHKKTYRCACVRDTGQPTVPAIVYEDESDDQQSGEHNIGDLNNPRLKQYEDCDPKSVECQIKD